MRAAVLLSALAVGCVPDLDTDDATVTGPIVLAVQAEPAEAAAGQAVTYRSLFVTSNGSTPGGRLSWFHCEARKPAAELGPVSRECFDAAGDKLVSIGKGLEVQGTMPSQACAQFGPNPPKPEGDSPPGRPADPDATGGYKQPVILGVVPDQGQPKTVLYEQRLYCGLAGVDPKTSGEFNQRYRRNVNPRVDYVDVKRAGGERTSLGDADVLQVRAGETLELAAHWAHCPSQAEDVCGDGICSIHELAASCTDDCAKPVPPGCPGQEEYLWLDVQAGALVSRYESLSLAWYATAGVYADERTGVAEEERAESTSNEWTAPSKAGEHKLWLVLRDSRGGVGFRELRVVVSP
ncbi:MAG: hypothetical protein QM778_23105 [Myxococcales bacterium]